MGGIEDCPTEVTEGRVKTDPGVLLPIAEGVNSGLLEVISRLQACRDPEPMLCSEQDVRLCSTSSILHAAGDVGWGWGICLQHPQGYKTLRTIKSLG